MTLWHQISRWRKDLRWLIRTVRISHRELCLQEYCTTMAMMRHCSSWSDNKNQRQCKRTRRHRMEKHREIKVKASNNSEIKATYMNGYITSPEKSEIEKSENGSAMRREWERKKTAGQSCRLWDFYEDRMVQKGEGRLERQRQRQRHT